MANQNPEQIARDTVDYVHKDSGWIVQYKKTKLCVEFRLTIKEYKTNVTSAD